MFRSHPPAAAIIAALKSDLMMQRSREQEESLLAKFLQVILLPFCHRAL